MMPVTLMNMPVFELFAGRFAQTHDLHIEVQFIPGQRMIEIKRHVVAFDRVDAGVAGLPLVIPDR